MKTIRLQLYTSSGPRDHNMHGMSAQRGGGIQGLLKLTERGCRAGSGPVTGYSWKLQTEHHLELAALAWGDLESPHEALGLCKATLRPGVGQITVRWRPAWPSP